MNNGGGMEASPALVTFLVGAISALAGFIVWLVKIVLEVLKDATSVMIEVKNAVSNNTTAFKENVEQNKEILKEILKKVED